MPVEYIIHIRQLTFLHHIANLDANDPVKRMYEIQKTLPCEKNWANNTAKLLKQYNIEDEVKGIIDTSKPTWKQIVKTSVTQVAFTNLKSACRSKSKTKTLEYTSYKSQTYLFDNDTKSTSIIFKLRARSADCRYNRKSSTSNLACRLCMYQEENQAHIINCPVVKKDEDEIDLSILDGDIQPHHKLIQRICYRYNEFLKLVNQSSETVTDES